MKNKQYLKLLLEKSLDAADSSTNEIEKFFIDQASRIQKELQKLSSKSEKTVKKNIKTNKKRKK